VRPDLVIFDCDGVLVDSERIHLALEVEMLAEAGWPLTAEEIAERFMGRSAAYQVAEVERVTGSSLPPGWLDRMEARLAERFDSELTAVDGLRVALDWLDAEGIPTYVASSGTHDKMRRTLGRTGLWSRFAGRIVGREDVEHGKPEPDLFLLAAARAGVDPAGCVVVEDSPYGLRAARAAGMRSIGYVGGFVAVSALAAEADTVIDDLRDLPDAIIGLAAPPAPLG
jgi:beta-phosphoglucomutase-like phosphatase (HAD superfamily)